MAPGKEFNVQCQYRLCQSFLLSPLFSRWCPVDLRSFPGNRGLPSNISAKMHPTLQISTMRMIKKKKKTIVSQAVQRNDSGMLDISTHYDILAGKKYPYQQRRISATSTWFLVHGSSESRHIQSSGDPEYEPNRNRKSKEGQRSSLLRISQLLWGDKRYRRVDRSLLFFAQCQFSFVPSDRSSRWPKCCLVSKIGKVVFKSARFFQWHR